MLAVKDQEITFIEVKEAKRILGIHAILSLNQTTQCKKMKEKMVMSIIRLNNTEILPHRIYLYFNAYLIKSIFFRCGIVKLENKQLKDLEKYVKW